MADEATLQSYLNDSLSIAALNSPTNTVLAGTRDAIKQVQASLKDNGISCTRLHVSHAFHSHLTEPVLPEFAKILSEVKLQPPKQPFVFVSRVFCYFLSILYERLIGRRSTLNELFKARFAF